MAQLFSALFFTVACVAALAMIATMLRGEWSRVMSILIGTEMAKARAAAPRIRVRTWNRPEPRRAAPAMRAAAA
jgi:hypothetical protein